MVQKLNFPRRSPISEGQIVRAQGKEPLTTSTDGKGANWFGPLAPLPPMAPDAVRGRAFDYPTGFNLSHRPRSNEGVSYAMLRSLADSYDLMRLVIETRKDQIENYEWEIVPREKFAKPSDDLVCDKVCRFLESPDKEHPWHVWLRSILEDMFVLDTVTIFPRKTRGGELFSLELVDPGTIKRVIDATGRTPVPPDPAYQQILKGLPAIDYTREELAFFVRNARSNRLYGYSPVEQVVMTVNIAMNRQLFQLNYFTEGNIPEALAGVPETWSMDQVKQFQLWWDSLMEGDLAQKRHMKFLPTDPRSVVFTKSPEMKDMFDEWLARIICFAFSIEPTALVKETNRATAETTAETAKKEGLMPLLNHLRVMINRLIHHWLGVEGCEFKWKLPNEVDPKSQAEIYKIYLDANVYDVNEVRSKLGEKELTPEEIEKRRAEKAPQAPMGPDGKPLPIATKEMDQAHASEEADKSREFQREQMREAAKQQKKEAA